MVGAVYTKTKLLQIALLSAALLCLTLFSFRPVKAEPVISQGYNGSSSFPAGAIVSLAKNSSDSVQLSTPATSSSMVGVVMDNTASSVSISSGSSQVQVASSGVNEVLVSDVNGAIAPGQEITVSPIAGVGELATASAEVIGTAQGTFPNSSATTQTLTTTTGRSQTVKVGSIPILVSVGYYTSQPTKTLIPTAFQNLANALAGKQVKPLPIIVSMVIFIITLIVVVSIIFSLVHGSIVSIGRNPMSQAAVYRNVIQLSSLVIGILAVAIIAIYLILTRLG